MIGWGVLGFSGWRSVFRGEIKRVGKLWVKFFGVIEVRDLEEGRGLGSGLSLTLVEDSGWTGRRIWIFGWI